MAENRRSRRFSFSSRRQQTAPPEEVQQGPPVTTIGFPIDAIPYPEPQTQASAGSVWKRAFRRSQSVDRAGEPPADRREARRLVKRPPISGGSRRDASVSSEAPRKSSNVPLISNISTRIRSRRASVSNNGDNAGLQSIDQQAGDKSANAVPSPPYRHDRTNSRDASQPQTSSQQVPRALQLKKDTQYIAKQEDAAPPTPTLRRVGSPFYHTASEKAAIARESISPGAYVNAEWNRLEKLDIPASNTSLHDSWQDDAMIPASLRVGRSKIVESGPKSPTLPMQENMSQHSLPKYSPPADDREKRSNTFDRSLSLPQETASSEPAVLKVVTKDLSKPVEKTAERVSDRVRSPRPSLQTDKPTHEWSASLPTSPVKTKSPSPRPKHAKTASSSSTASAFSSLSSSSRSAFGEPPTPISSNASVTNLETTTTTTSKTHRHAHDHSKTEGRKPQQEIPRNTISPKLDKYLAKIFVVCCHCNYWHDVPSGLYAKMVIPERLLFSGLPDPSETRTQSSSSSSRSSSQAPDSARWSSSDRFKKNNTSFVSLSSGASAYSASSSTSSSSPAPAARLPLSSPTATVRCSWCSHEMAQSCCASWTTMVHLIERHH